MLIAALAVAACGGSDGSTGPEVADYSGVWSGTTSGNRAVRIVVGAQTRIDSLYVTVRLSLGASACTGPMLLEAPVTVSNGSFSASLVFPGSTVTTEVRGRFDSNTSVSGSYEGYSGGFSLVCGSSFVVGTGSPLSAGTFTATRGSG